MSSLAAEMLQLKGSQNISIITLWVNKRNMKAEVTPTFIRFLLAVQLLDRKNIVLGIGRGVPSNKFERIYHNFRKVFLTRLYKEDLHVPLSRKTSSYRRNMKPPCLKSVRSSMFLKPQTLCLSQHTLWLKIQKDLLCQNNLTS